MNEWAMGLAAMVLGGAMLEGFRRILRHGDRLRALESYKEGVDQLLEDRRDGCGMARRISGEVRDLQLRVNQVEMGANKQAILLACIEERLRHMDEKLDGLAADFKDLKLVGCSGTCTHRH